MMKKSFISVLLIIGCLFLFPLVTKANEGYRQDVLNTTQAQVDQIRKQYNVNLYDLAKTSRMNKYQRRSFIYATEAYRRVLFYSIQNLEFYKSDLQAMNLANMDAGEANRRITEIRMKTNNEYNHVDEKTNEYLRTCSFVMPSLSFQRYAQNFKRNYIINDLYLGNYANIRKIDRVESKYKHQ